MSRAHTLQLLLGVTYLKKKSTYNKIFLLCSERRKQHMQKKKKRKTLEKKCPTCFARRQIFIFACKKLYSDCHAGFVRFSFVNLPLLLLWGISMRPRRPNTGWLFSCFRFCRRRIRRCKGSTGPLVLKKIFVKICLGFWVFGYYLATSSGRPCPLWRKREEALRVAWCLCTVPWFFLCKLAVSCRGWPPRRKARNRSAEEKKTLLDVKNNPDKTKISRTT